MKACILIILHLMLLYAPITSNGQQKQLIASLSQEIIDQLGDNERIQGELNTLSAIGINVCRTTFKSSTTSGGLDSIITRKIASELKGMIKDSLGNLCCTNCGSSSSNSKKESIIGFSIDCHLNCELQVVYVTLNLRIQETPHNILSNSSFPFDRHDPIYRGINLGDCKSNILDWIHRLEKVQRERPFNQFRFSIVENEFNNCHFIELSALTWQSGDYTVFVQYIVCDSQQVEVHAPINCAGNTCHQIASGTEQIPNSSTGQRMTLIQYPFRSSYRYIIFILSDEPFELEIDQNPSSLSLQKLTHWIESNNKISPIIHDIN